MGRIVISDVEGVLLDAEFLPLLANLQGKENTVQEITKKGIRGEISWEEGLKKRLEILRGANYKEAEEIGEKMPYVKGAKTFCKELRKRGYTLIGVTGGFNLFSERIKRELDLDYMISNELHFEDGELSGLKNFRVKSDKIHGLEEILDKECAESKEITAIADGSNNLKLFEYAQRKIAFNAAPIVKEHADIVVNSKDLRKVLEYMN